MCSCHFYSSDPLQPPALAPVRMVALVQELTPAPVPQDGLECCVKQVSRFSVRQVIIVYHSTGSPMDGAPPGPKNNRDHLMNWPPHALTRLRFSRIYSTYVLALYVYMWCLKINDYGVTVYRIVGKFDTLAVSRITAKFKSANFICIFYITCLCILTYCIM